MDEYRYYVTVYFESDKIAEFKAVTSQECLTFLNYFDFDNEYLRFTINDYLNRSVPYGFYDEETKEVRWR